MKVVQLLNAPCAGRLKIVGLAALLCLVSATGCATSTSKKPASDSTAGLSPGPTKDRTVFLDKARGYPFCEFEVVMGVPPDLTVQIYNTTGQQECLHAAFDPIDAAKLAKELKVDKVVKNPTRYWLMDRLWSYDAGETHDFAGMRATWMAATKLKMGQHGKPFPVYQEGVITRHSKYEWLKGSQVYLLRSPDGHTWIMQAYTNLVDRSLTAADLPRLGSKLNLPAGWKYEANTLERDLTLVPPAPDHLAHAVSDELQNIYAGCDFGTTCNYVP